MTLTAKEYDDSNGLFLDLCGRDGVMAIVYRRRDRDALCASLERLVQSFVDDCLSVDGTPAVEDAPLVLLMASRLEDLARSLRGQAGVVGTTRPV